MLKRQPRWFIIALLLLGAFTTLLFVLGPKGIEIAAVLAVPIGVIPILIAVRSLQAEHEQKARQAAEGVAPRRKKPSLKLVAICAFAVALAAAAGFILFKSWATSDVNVTGKITLSHSYAVGNGGQVMVQIPGTPPARGHIRLTPVLTNPAKTGDCVDPTRLDLTVFVDGQPRASETTYSGVEVDLSLDGDGRKAHVVITVRQQDPECVVDLRIDRAILHD